MFKIEVEMCTMCTFRGHRITSDVMLSCGHPVLQHSWSICNCFAN